jgi:signal transduction histidine kinase
MADVTQPCLDEFVATVSHELRTPLTSLQATLELLEEETLGGAPDSAQTVVYVEMALLQTRRLIRLATDLLDVSRLDGERRLRCTGSRSQSSRRWSGESSPRA